MYFVDEEDDFAVALCHFVDDGFESLLKLSLIFGTCHEGTHVKRENLLGAEVFGNVTTYYSLGKSLGDGGLTGTRFAYEHRVVFGASAKNLEHAAYLLVTSDYGVEFARAGAFVEVDGVLAECIVGVLCTLVGGFFAFT